MRTLAAVLRAPAHAGVRVTEWEADRIADALGREGVPAVEVQWGEGGWSVSVEGDAGPLSVAKALRALADALETTTN